MKFIEIIKDSCPNCALGPLRKYEDEWGDVWIVCDQCGFDAMF